MSYVPYHELWINTAWADDHKLPPAVVGVHTCYADAVLAAQKTLANSKGLTLKITAFGRNKHETYLEALGKQEKCIVIQSGGPKSSPSS
jgi:hypothetical protein